MTQVAARALHSEVLSTTVEIYGALMIPQMKVERAYVSIDPMETKGAIFMKEKDSCLTRKKLRKIN